MKKKNLLLTFLLAALVFGGAKAQTTVQIGNGTSANYQTPINIRDNYCFTELIYPSTAMNQTENKKITEIAFYYKGNQGALSFNVNIYMANIEDESFTTAAWKQINTEVFSGTMSIPNEEGWFTIKLDTEFEYDASQSLLIAINKTVKAGLSNYPSGCFNTTSTSNVHYTLYSNNTNNQYDPSTITGSGTRLNAYTNIIITFKDESSFPVPANLTASPIKTYEATLTWNETENATSYNVKYHETSSTDWTTETGLTTSTLALSNLDAETEYEAQVQAVYSEGSSEWSTVCLFTTLPLKNYTPSYVGQGWNYDAAWSPSGIPTINHDVTIGSGTVGINFSSPANANNIVITSGATLKIEPNAKLTCNSITNNGNLIIEDGGQLICNYSTTATTQKSIKAASTWGGETPENKPDGWYFIASPIDNGANGTDAGDVEHLTFGDYDLYRFNQSAVNGEWENYKAHQNDNLNPFKLYIKYGYLYANKNDVTLEFTGYTKPALNADSLLLAYDETALIKGWNLVGNPYVFNAYANKPYYKINNDKNDVELVSAYNANPIAPCTGIMVQATGTGQYVKFTKEAPAAPSKGSVELNLTGNGKRGAETLDKAIVSFNDGFELGKFYFGQQNANIYIPQNGEEYAIVSSEAQGEMPVNFKANVDGQYTISVNAEDVEMGYLHLIDNMTGADIDLLSTPSYTFNASTTDYASRFRIVFAGNSVNEFDTEDNFAFISNGQVIVNNEGFATLQVIDITGRIISSEIINGSCSTNLNAATGVYVLRLINGENVKTQKIVVK